MTPVTRILNATGTLNRGIANMKLTDAERAEFIALANATLDPEMWSEDELPILRKTKADNDRQQEWERNHPHLIEQPILTDDDENGWPYDLCTDRRYRD